jgi:hypothetical protein
MTMICFRAVHPVVQVAVRDGATHMQRLKKMPMQI